MIYNLKLHQIRIINYKWEKLNHWILLENFFHILLFAKPICKSFFALSLFIKEISLAICAADPSLKSFLLRIKINA